MSMPDFPELLLQAIRQRDVGKATLLLQRWAHRSGLRSLQDFQSGQLLKQEGPEACSWLQELMAPSVPTQGARQPETQQIELIIGQPQEPCETGKTPSKSGEHRELTRSAPLPASLADLRAWLSDPVQTLPGAS